MTSSPIADLSYRNYDGPLDTARMRWWVIAKMTMRLALKKRVMWVCMALSGWYYIAMIFVLFFMEQFTQTSTRPGQPNPVESFIAKLIWKDQFLHGFSYGQIMFMAITLIIGAGAIANDNRANALLVYLSKPCTKTDYLLGKWVGVFLPLWLTMMIPSMVFLAYGGLSYRSQGFFFQDPWVFPKVLIMLFLGAALHSSLIIGFSSMFKQGRIAGAAYAGLYFLSNFFTQMMTVAYIAFSGGPKGRGEVNEIGQATVGKLAYASIDGLNIGLARSILAYPHRSSGSGPFGLSSLPLQAPPLFPILFIVLALIVVSLGIAWTRIRAVEVVG